MTAFHGGAGGCFPGRANGSCPLFSETFFRDSSLELEKAKPFARSREEIASFAVLDGGDHGEIGSRSPLYSDLSRTDSQSQSKAREGELGCCGLLSHSGPLPQVAIGDGKIEAGSRLHSCLTRPELCSALAMQAVKIKEELEEEEVATTAAILSPSCSWQAAAYDVAKPMEDLGVVGPTPFLRKTYEMVSDPGTDPVVSWGLSQDSFVVWDRQEFSKQVLPRYFKHSNFSSFIRQLNTYGFRKMDADRWEFANRSFQEGKKHLLKNIRRRRKLSGHTKTLSRTVASDYPEAGKEAELEMLKKDQEALKTEILKLREEREHSQHEINQVAKRIRYAECRCRQIFLLLSKATKSPNFVHLIQERRQKRESEACESSEKSKLLSLDSGATKCLLEVMVHKIQSPNVDCPRVGDDPGQMESWPNNIAPVDFQTVQMHNPWPPTIGSRDFRAVQGRTPDQKAGASPSDLPSVFHEMSEKLLGDNVVMGDDAMDVESEELAMDDTGIYLELEGLIEKSCGWSDNTSELWQQAVGLTP